MDKYTKEFYNLEIATKIQILTEEICQLTVDNKIDKLLILCDFTETMRTFEYKKRIQGNYFKCCCDISVREPVEE